MWEFWGPILAAIITSLIVTVVIGTLLDSFIRPYIEVRKAKIAKKKISGKMLSAEAAKITTILDLLISDIENIKNQQNTPTRLIPTVKNIHSTRISILTRSLESSINLSTDIHAYSKRYNSKEFIDHAVNAMGGLEKIKDNIQKDKITGRNALINTNLVALKKYRDNLARLFSEMPI